jgi:hypothetical protein
MEIKKVTDFKELDELIPLIQKLYGGLGIDKYITLSGYISWITMGFPSGNFQIWKGEKDGIVVGYLIANITQRFLIKECSIVDAFMDVNDTEATDFVFQKVNEWAKEMGCTQISIVSKRDKAFMKRYNFDFFGSILIQKI